jgi:uncharacterized protein (DUF2461 family)
MLRPMSRVDKSSSPPDNPSLLVGRNWFERLLVSFIADHTPKCREVVKLLSQSMEVRLPMSTRIKLRFHFLICAWCQRYEKQLRALRKIAASAPEHVDQICPETLSDSSKERLKRALRGREP